MTIQITPGFGTSVATTIKGGAHHQNVITHVDRFRVQNIPPVLTTEYPVDTYIGGEMTIQAATRFAGDFADVSSLQIALRGNQTGAELDIVFYSDPLDVTPVNGVAPVLSNNDVLKIAGIVRVPIESFVKIGNNVIAHVDVSSRLVVQGSAGGARIMAAIIARSVFTPFSTESLVMTTIFKRD